MNATENQFSFARAACSIVSVCATVLSTVAQAQFTFTTNNGAITIANYTGTAPDVIIPSTINGYPVRTVGTWAFGPSTNVLSITIPDTVTNLGTAAFDSCYNLSSVSIGTNVLDIGDGAFGLCFSLTNLTVPASVRTLGPYAFASSGLTSILFQGSPPVPSVDVFQLNDNVIVYYLLGATNWPLTYCGRPTSLWNPAAPYFLCAATNGLIIITGYIGPGGDVLIPDTLLALPVASIADQAFQSCTRLTTVTIPNSVATIGFSAFDSCYNLASVRIPDSVISLGSRAFEYCTNLVEVAIGHSLGSLASYTFKSCSKLPSLGVPGGVTNIGDYAFQDCTSMSNISFGVGLASLGTDPFCNCSNLRSMTVDTLNLFYSGLDGVLFDKSTNTIIRFPAAKTNNYILPAKVTSIGSCAFKDSVVLAGVDVPDTVSSIGYGAFANCFGLTNVAIPIGVTNIGDYAFYSCGKLSSITLPPTVVDIGSYAFRFCKGLSYVTIPNSVTNIGDWAFEECTALKGVYFAGNLPAIGGYTFYNYYYAPPPTLYYLPGTVGWGGTINNCPTVPWVPVIDGGGRFGMHTNRFGFNITGAANMVVVVEACQDLASPRWNPLATNTLTSGSAWFSDPQWTNFVIRLYHLRMP